jgi:hypothetical protein
VSKLGGETPSQIRAWSLIRNKNIFIYDNIYCHACEVRGQCMRKEMQVIPVDRLVDKKKELLEKTTST